MGRVLAAEDGAGLGHHLLDEGMADPRADRGPAHLAHDLGHDLRADEVVHDRLSGVPLEDPLGEDGGGDRARQGLRLVVDEEDAVGVAVERQPDVGAGVEHGPLQVLEVLELDRVGGMVRERPVELGIEDRQVERQVGERGGDDGAAHAVGRVGHDTQRAQRVDVDERVDVLDVLGEQVALLDPAPLGGPLEEPARDRRLDLGQPRVLADGGGAGAAQLDPVVLGGVVAGSEHRRRRVEPPRREVHEVGRDQTELDDVGAGQGGAVGERGRERLRRRPHVPPHQHQRGARERDERVPDTAGDVVAEVVGVQPADVVGLEDRVESLVAHSAAGYPASPPALLGLALCCFLRLRHHGQTASPATPNTPATVPTRPRYSAVVVE